MSAEAIGLIAVVVIAVVNVWIICAHRNVNRGPDGRREDDPPPIDAAAWRSPMDDTQ